MKKLPMYKVAINVKRLSVVGWINNVPLIKNNIVHSHGPDPLTNRSPVGMTINGMERVATLTGTTKAGPRVHKEVGMRGINSAASHPKPRFLPNT